MTTQNFRVRKGLTIEGATNGSTNIAAPATGSDVNYVLPGAQGASSTVLTNDGSGNLSWALPGGGGSTFGNVTVGVDTDNTISTTTGDLTIDSATNLVGIPANLTVNSGTLFVDATTNRVGINNLAPAYELHIDQGLDGFTQFGMTTAERTALWTMNDGDDLLSLSYGSGSRLQFDPTNQWFVGGYTGINTATPAYTLDVNGQGNFQGVITGGLKINGATSGYSNFIAPTTGSTLNYSLPGTAGAANTVLTNDGSGNLTWALPGGGGSTFGNVSIGVDTDQTISTTSGNLILQTAAGVNAGNMTLTAGANGAITLSPNGTGNVAVNVNNGGNLTNTRNYVLGSIRDATTLAAGDAWSFGSGAVNLNVRGISLDNTGDTTKRPGMALRGYSNQRPFIIGENNRGTVASPLATASGNNLLEIAASGWNGTQWVTDAVTVAPISISLQAAEAFTSPAGVNTANGSRLRVDAQPTGVTATALTRSAIINHTPNTATYRSDAWTFATREVAAGGTNTTQMTLDSSGNCVLTGDLAVNGGDITTTSTGTATIFNTNAATVNIGNAATAMTIGSSATAMTIGNSAGIVTVGGDLRVNGNDIISSSGQTVMSMITNDAIFADAVQVNGSLRARQGLTYDMLITSIGVGENVLSLIKDTNTTSIEQPVINFASYRSTAGTYSPTQSGDRLGQYKFNGNVSSTTTPLSGSSPAVSISTVATENWTPTATGAKLSIGAVKNGATSSTTIIDHSPTLATYSADTFTFESSTGTDYLTLDGSGNVVITGDLQINGNDIKASDGNIAETFTTITGQSPNTGFTGNIVKGAIRNAPTQANGDIFTFSAAGTGGPTQGLSIDNSIATAHRPGVVLRSYGGGLGAGNPQATFITETARGSAATPTGLSSSNSLGSWLGSGYADTTVGGANPGWATDTTGNNTVGISFITTEAWTSGTTNLGTQVSIRTNPTSSGNAIQNSMTINPQSTISRSDAFTWQNGKSGTTQTMALDVNGNLIVTGDVRINGNDIQASDGSTNITLTSNTLTTFAGDIRLNGGDIQNPGGTNAISVSSGNVNTVIRGDNVFVNLANGQNVIQTYQNGGKNVFSVNQLRATTNSEFALTNFTTQRSTDGINYTPTLTGDHLGQFKFNGNAYTSTTPGVPAGPGAQISAKATENWTSTANGTNISFVAIKKGTLTDVALLSLASDTSSILSDVLYLKDSSDVLLTGNKINYNRVYGQWQYNTTVTPAASNTAYVFPLGTQDFANIASVGSTSRLIPGALGMYKTQFSVQVDNSDNGTEHTAYIWWRKNGTDVPGSMGRVTVPKGGQTIAGWDNMIEITNTSDYYELAYAVDDATHLSFPAFSSTAFGPATAALFTTLVPVGA